MKRFYLIISFAFFIFACSSVNTPTKISKFEGTYQGAVVSTRAISLLGTAIINISSDNGVNGEIRLEDQSTIDIITVEADPIYVKEISETSYSVQLSNYILYLTFTDSGKTLKIECISSTRTITGTLPKK